MNRPDSRPERRRGAGFTLLEVMLALVLTAIAVTIASAALRTATTARDVVAVHRLTLERESRVRASLTDMLRHAPRADAVREPLLRVTRTARGDARLIFLSQGVRAPYGTGGIWRVTVSVERDSLTVDAEPIGAVPDGTRLHSVLAGVPALRVLVLEPRTGSARARWRDDWPLDRARPSMIAVRFGDDKARPPLMVALDPLALNPTAAPTRVAVHR